MRYDARNGYAFWKVRDRATGAEIRGVLWVDPDARTYRQAEQPLRVVGNDIAANTYPAHAIEVEATARTFWISLLRRDSKQPKPGEPCDRCTQPETCARIHYCAAYRCRFGEVDKP